MATDIGGPSPGGAAADAMILRSPARLSADYSDRRRDLMELNGWTSPQMLTRYGASARGARARRSYDRIMNDTT